VYDPHLKVLGAVCLKGLL